MRDARPRCMKDIRPQDLGPNPNPNPNLNRSRHIIQTNYRPDGGETICPRSADQGFDF